MDFTPTTPPAGASPSHFAEAPEASSEQQPVGPVLVVPAAKPPKLRHRWLLRLMLVVKVLFCLEIGIVLMVVPWTSLWTNNPLLAGVPALKEFLNQNFVRGVATGLGLIDIWIGVAEAVTYRERV